MSKTSWLVLCSLSLCAISPLVSAQEISFTDLVRGDKLAPAMKAEALPESFRPFKISTTGMGSLMDSYFEMFGGIFGAMGGMMGGMMGAGQAAAAPMMDMISVSGLTWTDGSTVRLGGAEYLVTYKVSGDMGPLFGEMMRSTGGASSSPGGMAEEEPPVEVGEQEEAMDGPPAPNAPFQPPMPPMAPRELQLTLIRVDTLATISPVQGWTRERLIRALNPPAPSSPGMTKPASDDPKKK